MKVTVEEIENDPREYIHRVLDDVREELDRRLAAYYADPSSARPWHEIKEELFGSR